MTKWTTEQKQTIETRDKNILVAAAAGSGKTAVMVERITRLILEGRASLNEMLVTTFTKAAAAEMKEKIRKSLKKEAVGRPELRRELELLPQAKISTIDAFALEVVKQFFYEIDREPDFSTCDETQSTILREEALDDLLEEAYEEGTPEFYNLLSWYGSERGDETVRSVIATIYKELMTMPDPFGVLEEKVQELSLDWEEYAKTTAGTYLNRMVLESLNLAEQYGRTAISILDGAELQRLSEKALGDMLQYADMKELAASAEYEALMQALQNFKQVSLRASSDEKPVFDSLKNEFNECRKNARDELKRIQALLYGGKDQWNQDLHLAAPIARTLQTMLKRYHEIFMDKKAQQKLMDFNDIEHECLRILKTPAAAEFYRSKFKYIFIDEYQDTSILQETIMQQIAGDRNLFMVGDVKQSIYRFRNAEPEIFRGKYRLYEACQDDSCVKIDLNRNFRSKPSVLSWINHIFRGIMEGYDDKAKLYPGIDAEPAYLVTPEMKIVDTGDTAELSDDNLAELKAVEQEAIAIADLIEQNLGRVYWDSKEGREKTLQYRDMVILKRKLTNAAELMEILERRGIPVFLVTNDGYFDTMEIQVFMNLLSLIDNRYQDLPMISVLRSEIFGFTENELAEVRTRYPEGSYVTALQQVAAEEDAFAHRCKEVLDQINQWKVLAGAIPLEELTWRLLTETGYYIAMGAMPNGPQRQSNLRALCDRAEQFAENGQSSLYGFIRYMESAKENKVKVGQGALLSEKDDVVRIMTIHKSKGLEFPLVIVSGMGENLMYTSRKSKALFHKELGLGLFLEDPEMGTEKTTLTYDLILEKVKQEELAEQIRLLYVALTRAKDFLFLTGTYKGNKTESAETVLQGKKEQGLLGGNTYLDLMTSLPNVEFIDGYILSAMSGLGDAKLQEQLAAEVAEREARKAAAEAKRLADEAERLAREEAQRSGETGPVPEPGEMEVPMANKATTDAVEPEPVSEPEMAEEAAPVMKPVKAEMTEPASTLEPETQETEEPSTNLSPEEAEELACQVNLKLNWSYPGEKARSLQSKYSVSDLNHAAYRSGESEDGTEEWKMKVPKFLQGEQKLSAADRGTIYHGLMERLDFVRAAEEGEPYVKARLQECVDQGIFLENEAEVIRPSVVMKFFREEIGQRAVAAAREGKLHREQSFNLVWEKDSEPILIQGIIDCFFEEKGKIVLIDYKTSWIDPDLPYEEEEKRLRETYAQQIQIYGRALSEATGLPVEEGYLYLIFRGNVIPMEV